MRLLLIGGMSHNQDTLVEELEEESVHVDVVIVSNTTFSLRGRSRLATKIKESKAEGIVLVIADQPKLIELLPILREVSGLPVLVSGSPAVSDWEEEVRCLKLGAWDYLSETSPVYVMLLRMQRLIHLSRGMSQPFSYHRGLVELVESREYLWQSTSLDLTATEYKVLHLLLNSSGNIVSKETLLRQIWQKDIRQEGCVLTTMVRKLRQKLEPVPLEIVNCYGKGYCCKWVK